MTDQTTSTHETTDRTGADHSAGPSWMDRCWEQMRQFMGEASAQQDFAGCCGHRRRPPRDDHVQK